MTKSEDVLYRVLHWALVEIRIEAVTVKNNKIFAISNTFHNLPLWLLEAKDEADYDALLIKLEEWTKDNEGLSGILNHVKRTMKDHQQGQ